MTRKVSANRKERRRETLANIREAIELFLETLTDDERSAAQSKSMPKAPRLSAALAGAMLESGFRLASVQG